LKRANQKRSDVAISDWELSNKISTTILVKNQIFFSGCTYKQVGLCLFIVFVAFVGLIDSVVIGNARISFALFMLVSFSVVVILIVDRIVK
jgi:hypothetical protein